MKEYVHNNIKMIKVELNLNGSEKQVDSFFDQFDVRICTNVFMNNYDIVMFVPESLKTIYRFTSIKGLRKKLESLNVSKPHLFNH